MNSDVVISSEVISVGNSRFIRECAIPTIDDIQDIASATFDASKFVGLGRLRHSRPQAGGLADTLIGILICLGSWLSAKVLNDIYAETLGRKVRACIRRAVESSPEKSRKCIALVIGSRPKDATVVIAVTGVNESELLRAEAHIPMAISAISGLSNENASRHTVYLYRLNGGSMDLMPQQYETVQAAIQDIERPERNES